jgi:MYXO-CTERM domain-containing protein
MTTVASGMTMRLIPKTTYTFTNVATSASMSFLLCQHIDCSVFQEASFLIRAHSGTIGVTGTPTIKIDILADGYVPPSTGSGGGGPGSGGGGPGAGGGGPGAGGAGPGSGGHQGHGGGANACTPGQQVECACPGGTKGVQDCKADGSGFNTCQCDGSNSGGGGAGPGSSGGCGCRFSDDETRAGWPLLVALAALFGRRRRRAA